MPEPRRFGPERAKLIASSFEMTPIMAPLAPFRDRLLVLSGLAHDNATAQDGEGAGEHARASAVFLTSVHPKKTEGLDFRAGISVDREPQRYCEQEGNQLQSPVLENDVLDVPHTVSSRSRNGSGMRAA